MRCLVFWIIAFLTGFLIGLSAFPCPARADTLYLPLLRGGYVVTVTGVARWEPDFGPVAHRHFTLLAVVSEDPFLIFRHNSDSPQARTDSQGHFAFQGVADGVYVLGIEERPPFNWAPVMYEGMMYLVEVEGQSVAMEIVRVGVTHQWGE